MVLKICSDRLDERKRLHHSSAPHALFPRTSRDLSRFLCYSTRTGCGCVRFAREHDVGGLLSIYAMSTEKRCGAEARVVPCRRAPFQGVREGSNRGGRRKRQDEDEVTLYCLWPNTVWKLGRRSRERVKGPPVTRTRSSSPSAPRWPALRTSPCGVLGAVRVTDPESPIQGIPSWFRMLVLCIGSPLASCTGFEGHSDGWDTIPLPESRLVRGPPS